MLHEHRHCPIADAAFIDLGLDTVGDFVQPLTVRANFEFFVMNVHGLQRENNTARNNSRALIFPPAVA